MEGARADAMSDLSRRRFMQLSIGGVVAAAAVRTFPFRVYSFSQEIVLAPATALTNLDRYEVHSHFYDPRVFRGREKTIAGVRGCGCPSCQQVMFEKQEMLGRILLV